MEKKQIGNFTLEIEPDECPINPREDFDNLGTMVCFHGRYNLGDKTEYRKEDYSSWGELEAAIQREEKAAIILPLYLYDHSGLRIKVGSFHGLLPGGHAEFDSGQVGFIFVSRETLRKEYKVKRVTKTLLERAEKILRSEVETYDQYLSGDVWAYRVTNAEGDVLECCCGYFGQDDAFAEGEIELEYAAAEAHVLDYQENNLGAGI